MDFPVKNAAQPATPEAPALRSADGGRTWTRFFLPPLESGQQSTPPVLLRAHPAVSGLLFAASGPRLWRSSDAGVTWMDVYTARPREANQPGRIAIIGFDELAPSTVYLFSTDGFSISETVVTRPAVVRTDALGNVFIAGTVLADETAVTAGAYASPGRARRFCAVAWMAGSRSPDPVNIQIARLRPYTLETEFSTLLGGECGSRPTSMAVTADSRVTVAFVTQHRHSISAHPLQLPGSAAVPTSEPAWPNLVPTAPN